MIIEPLNTSEKAVVTCFLNLGMLPDVNLRDMRIVLGLMVLLVLPVSVFAFSDVDNKAWYYDYVSELQAEDTLRGYDDGTFRPGNFATRAELAAALARLDTDTKKQNYNLRDVFWALLPSVVVVIGWGFVFWNDRRILRQNKLIDTKFDIYFRAASKIDAINFGLMSACVGSSHFVRIKILVSDANQFVDKRDEYLFKAKNLLLDYSGEYIQSRQNFTTEFLAYIRIFELWEPFLVDVAVIKKVLLSEYQELFKMMNEYSLKIGALKLDVVLQRDFDEINELGNKIADQVLTLQVYVEDSLKILAAELLTDIVKDYQPVLRQTLSEDHKVLTKAGLIVNLNPDPDVYRQQGIPVPDSISSTNVTPLPSPSADSNTKDKS